MKIYLCPAHLKNTLLDLLRQDKKVILGIKIMTPEAYIQEKLGLEKKNFYEVYKELSKLELKDLRRSIEDIVFLQRLLDDRRLIDIYKIAITKLTIHPEYKKLLTALAPYPDLSVLYKKEDLADIFIVNANYDICLYDILAKMVENGAHYVDFPAFLNYDNRVLKVINNRLGIDNIAQIIIKNDFDLKRCALCINKSDIDLVVSHCKRYGIPLDIKFAYKTSLKARKIASIVDLYLQFDLKHYRELVSLDLFESKGQKALSVYLSEHVDEIPLEELSRFKDFDNDYYQRLETLANEAHRLYRPLLIKLKEANSIKEALNSAFETVNQDDDETLSLKNIIEKYRDDIDEGYPFLRQELLSCQLKEDGDGLKVITYDQEIYGIDHLFILDPNINNYPAFRTKEGFLNEDVLKDTNYPSLKRRYDLNIAHFHFFNCSLDTTFILTQSTLDGKGTQYATQFAHYPKIDPLYNDEDRRLTIPYKRKLKNTAVFFREGVLQGSISAFERYFNCPYSYYLNDVLKLYEDQNFALNAAFVGVLYHEVLEKVVSLKGKDYPLDYKSVSDGILDKYKRLLDHIYPLKKEEIRAIIYKIANSLDLEMVFLDDFEKHNDYKPTSFEYRIKECYLDDGEHKVAIKGIIDRVDTFGDYFRIIDYKTSDHSLSEKDIARGLKLQLLTYMILYARTKKMVPAGIFYLNAKHETINIDKYTYSVREGLKEKLIDNEVIYEEFIKAHRLKGLFFEIQDELDDDGRHIARGKKKFVLSNTAAFSKAVRIMDTIYTYLYDRLKDGDISLSPTGDACKYCRFHTICHFRGLYDLREEIIKDLDIERGEDAAE